LTFCFWFQLVSSATFLLYYRHFLKRLPHQYILTFIHGNAQVEIKVQLLFIYLFIIGEDSAWKRALIGTTMDPLNMGQSFFS
jgi:hypothetical protein